METSTLLNINTKLHKSSADLTGQALVIDAFANKNAESFKSAFNHQADKHVIRKTQIKKEKELPQNGNELPDKPDKKITSEKNADEQKKTNANEQSNISGDEKHTKNLEKTAKTEQAKDHEPVNRDEPSNNGQSTNNGEAASSTEAANIDDATSSSETVKSVELDNSFETVRNAAQETGTEQIHLDVHDIEQNWNEKAQLTVPLQTDEINNNESLEQEMDSEQLHQSLLNNNQANPNASYSGYQISGEKVPDTLSADKKAHSEPVSGQQFSNQSIPSGNLMAEMSTRSGTDSKNESPLSKNIADFHQYIEMSKKHSMSGESIASIKTFEESLKKSQLNTQFVRSEIKLPVGQNLQSGQTPVQAVPVARSNPVGGALPTPGVQNIPSLEVKTTVGKSGWNQGLSSQIAMMASNGIQHAKIKLNPAHLGPVEATVKITSEVAVINLSSLHLTTKDAMENAIPRLKEMLNENGFSQVDVNVSHQDKKEQQEAALNSKTGSNNEHGKSTMPGDEQLSEVSQDPESDERATDSLEQGLNIVDYYA